MQPSIKVLKLVSGDEIIGIVYDGQEEDTVEDGYSVDHLFFVRGPMKILCEYDPLKKTHSLFLADWMPSVDNDVLPIDKSKVITVGTPVLDLEEHYCELMLIKIDQEQTEEEKKETKYKKILKGHKFDDDDVQ